MREKECESERKSERAWDPLGDKVSQDSNVFVKKKEIEEISIGLILFFFRSSRNFDSSPVCPKPKNSSTVILIEFRFFFGRIDFRKSTKIWDSNRRRLFRSSEGLGFHAPRHLPESSDQEQEEPNLMQPWRNSSEAKKSFLAELFSFVRKKKN